MIRTSENKKKSCLTRELISLNILYLPSQADITFHITTNILSLSLSLSEICHWLWHKQSIYNQIIF